MSPAIEQVYRSALTLPASDLDELLDALIAADSGGLPFAAEWQAVAERRSAELDAGTVVAESWEAVRARAHKKVGLDD